MKTEELVKVESVIKENTILKNKVSSLNDYIKALEEECRLAKEVIDAYKENFNLKQI